MVQRCLFFFKFNVNGSFRVIGFSSKRCPRPTPRRVERDRCSRLQCLAVIHYRLVRVSTESPSAWETVLAGAYIRFTDFI